MDKATKAIRRSGVRIKALSGGHVDLQMLISELKDVRQAAKTFMQAQTTATQDLLKWSISDENRAIQDISSLLAELNSMWTEVQKEFTEQLKDFKYNFETILEGERHVDQARNHLLACEQRESRIKKELKKMAKKATSEELRQLEIRLAHAERSKDMAQIEVFDRIRENEIWKMIRYKDGLLKVSEAYVELANKCAVIFEAQREIAYQLPDVQGKELHEVKYTGTGACKRAVMRAKDHIREYQRPSCDVIPRGAAIDDDLPPPYTPSYYYIPGIGQYTICSFSSDITGPYVNGVDDLRVVDHCTNPEQRNPDSGSDGESANNVILGNLNSTPVSQPPLYPGYLGLSPLGMNTSGSALPSLNIVPRTRPTLGTHSTGNSPSPNEASGGVADTGGASGGQHRVYPVIPTCPSQVSSESGWRRSTADLPPDYEDALSGAMGGARI